MTWSGAVSGTGSCDGAASDALLAVATSTSGSLNWLVDAQSETHRASFGFEVPNPPDANSYTGGANPAPSCTATLTPKTAGTTSFQAISRPSAATGAPARGSCSIEFTSKTDTSSKSTTRFTVHGTAKATLEAGNGSGETVQLSVTF